jgi:hypothetical protein
MLCSMVYENRNTIMVTDLCWYDTEQGDNCQWECSDIPGSFYCKDCDGLRVWNRFAQAYSFYVREGHYGF